MGETNEDDIINFLWRSNQIEGVHSLTALQDAIKVWEAATYARNFLTSVWGVYEVLAVHNDLITNLNPRIAGKLTTVQTTVGGRDNPAPDRVKGLLEKWCEEYGSTDFMKGKSECHGIEEGELKVYLSGWIKEAHIAFEKIHPFEDGNGRVGRIIMNQQRLAVGLPIFTVWPDGEWALYENKEHNIFQRNYYKWF